MEVSLLLTNVLYIGIVSKRSTIMLTIKTLRVANVK